MICTLQYFTVAVKKLLHRQDELLRNITRSDSLGNSLWRNMPPTLLSLHDVSRRMTGTHWVSDHLLQPDKYQLES